MQLIYRPLFLTMNEMQFTIDYDMAQVYHVLSLQWMTTGIQESQNLIDGIDWYSERRVNGCFHRHTTEFIGSGYDCI